MSMKLLHHFREGVYIVYHYLNNFFLFNLWQTDLETCCRLWMNDNYTPRDTTWRVSRLNKSFVSLQSIW
jgi:hypothetical protein